jgi:hypothetical protein
MIPSRVAVAVVAAAGPQGLDFVIPVGLHEVPVGGWVCPPWVEWVESD